MTFWPFRKNRGIATRERVATPAPLPTRRPMVETPAVAPTRRPMVETPAVAPTVPYVDCGAILSDYHYGLSSSATDYGDASCSAGSSSYDSGGSCSSDSGSSGGSD